MRRFLSTLLIVICLAGLLSRCELDQRRHAQGQDSREPIGFLLASLGPSDWVRTRDGWERRHVLQPAPRSEPWPLPHPGVIAALQLGLSMFALLAFPSRAHVMAGEGAAAKPQASRRKRWGRLTRQGATAS